MFTGIITDVGEIVALEQRGDLKARIKTAYDTKGIELGASIASDGVCLTVIALGDDWYDVEISAETVSKTNLGDWSEGRPVNLERALKFQHHTSHHREQSRLGTRRHWQSMRPAQCLWCQKPS